MPCYLTDFDRPDIQLPVAGAWYIMLPDGSYAKCCLQNKIGKDERQLYFDFAKNHTMYAESVLLAGLLRRLADKRKRQWGSNIYCLSDFYNFLSFLESTFLKNLTLKMVMSHLKNNLVYAITCHLTKNKTAFANVSPLSSKDDSQHQKLLVYVLDWYTNTRGMHSVKHIWGSSGNNIRKKMDLQATWVRVANAVACSEAVSKIESEEEETRIWRENKGTIVNDADIFNDKWWM